MTTIQLMSLIIVVWWSGSIWGGWVNRNWDDSPFIPPISVGVCIMVTSIWILCLIVRGLGLL